MAEKREFRSQILIPDYLKLFHSENRSSVRFYCGEYGRIKRFDASDNKVQLCEFLYGFTRFLSNTLNIFMKGNFLFHQSTVLREFMKSQGQRKFFIPPYPPQLTPIDLLFPKWKSVMKHGMSILDGNTL
ncbi:hypothetical protein RF11_10647 [Thelohanellus kitauei]|uniref:Tc1-like transposase DDE domain-containing protein n=1 Tax=Thelohanellus kitauei TaxID=669202 RepID=A0A0C2N6Y2_THEKT|nr:hypothetical protein RF11_10647 [Thelohanellus kitauei]